MKDAIMVDLTLLKKNHARMKQAIEQTLDDMTSSKPLRKLLDFAEELDATEGTGLVDLLMSDEYEELDVMVALMALDSLTERVGEYLLRKGKAQSERN